MMPGFCDNEPVSALYLSEESRARLSQNCVSRRPLLCLPDLHGGPCNLFAPELVRIHQERSDLSVIYVGRGDAEENCQKAEEHGFQFPVVLQKRWELSKQYGIFATPVAFWIDAEGMIAQSVAQGGAEILALLSPQEVSLTA